jgi:hypothetical protein
MSIGISISGEIIESANYLSNAFVTITSDQTIYGNKTISHLLFDDLCGNHGFHNVSTISLNDNSNNTLLNTTGLQINTPNYSSSFNNQINLSDASNNLNITSNSFTLTNLNLQNLQVLINTSGLYFSNDAQINASVLDISSTNLKFNGNSGTFGQYLTSNGNGPPTWETNKNLYGSTQIEPTINRGTIFYGKTFSNSPFVVISQLSPNRIVPICITEINTSSFNWAAVSSGVGTIIWNAGIN